MMPVEDVLARARAFVKLVRGPKEARRSRKAKAIGPQLVLTDVIPAPKPLEKTIWGSPAGKKRIAARLAKLIPAHTTYVEPFVGSGAVFFEKEPVDKEVLGDADPEIASAFQAIKTLSAAELDTLRRKNWVGREKQFRAMQEAKPKSKVEKLYRFLYLSHFSYGKLRGKSYNPNAEGVEAKTISRLEKFRDRLKNVTVRSSHYAKVVKEFDSKDTFFFLDPPYPGHDVEVGEDVFDEEEFRKVLEGIKGKFLVTYGTRGKLDTSGFHVRKIRTPRTIRAMRGVEGPKTLPQLLIANYSITEKSLGFFDETLLLDDVDVVDLDEQVSAGLEHARALAKALVEETHDEGLSALLKELGRFEPEPGERSTTLARELSPIIEELLPELDETFPSLAEAFRSATPTMDALSKAQWTRAYINDLPDSAFLYIEPGGKRDDDGKTVPRSLRHFPVRNREGELDVPHLRNAIARAPQSRAPGLTAEHKQQVQEEARRLLAEVQDAVGKVDETPVTRAPTPPADRVPSEQLLATLQKQIPLLKTDEERYVLGIVLEPETVDAQKDIYSALEVRDAAHRFMEEFQNLGLMHRELVNGAVKILESYVAPAEFDTGGTKVRKGTWLLAVRVLDEKLWEQVKSGELTGFSIGGSAVRNPE